MKQTLLKAADGPEYIEIYIDKDRGTTDWCSAENPVYLYASLDGASIQLGPFHLASIYNQLKAQIKTASQINAIICTKCGSMLNDKHAGHPEFFWCKKCQDWLNTFGESYNVEN